MFLILNLLWLARCIFKIVDNINELVLLFVLVVASGPLGAILILLDHRHHRFGGYGIV